MPETDERLRATFEAAMDFGLTEKSVGRRLRTSPPARWNASPLASVSRKLQTSSRGGSSWPNE
jgi:hypothetical protein